MIGDLYGAVSAAHARIREIQDAARSGNAPDPGSVRWPAIVLRTPKGWTGPRVVDGVQVEGTFRAHQVPLSNVRDNPEHLEQLERLDAVLSARLAVRRGRPTRPGPPRPRAGRRQADVRNALREWRPVAGAAVSSAAGEVRPCRSPSPASSTTRTRNHSANCFATSIRHDDGAADGGGNFRLFCPDETASNRLSAVFEVTDRCMQVPILPTDDHLSADGRVMEVLSEHLCQGWLEGYLLTGRHGLFATYEAFAMVSASMLVQHTKWLQHAQELPWRMSVASSNVLLTSTCWRNDHNGFSHQGPGLIDTAIPLAPDVVRVWLPPDANTTLSIGRHCLESRDHVNLIVVDKQDHLQYLSIDDAEEHCAGGAGVWDWAGTEDAPAERRRARYRARLRRRRADAGDARRGSAAARARPLPAGPGGQRGRPDGHCCRRTITRTGSATRSSRSLFTRDTDVVFAFHGYPRAIHELLHGRLNPGRFHVRGFNEQGTTTTPFDMVVLNRMSRYHLVIEALRRSRRIPENGERLVDFCRSAARPTP